MVYQLATSHGSLVKKCLSFSQVLQFVKGEFQESNQMREWGQLSASLHRWSVCLVDFETHDGESGMLKGRVEV